ncbi:hypothetical protein BC827DRAFT_1232520 [Russula dissimulans]|jgi:hypothetical protein|nr:hypothetical protein BC827DRAFT_1232520 [Russula dissimulans]
MGCSTIDEIALRQSMSVKDSPMGFEHDQDTARSQEFHVPFRPKSGFTFPRPRPGDLIYPPYPQPRMIWHSPHISPPLLDVEGLLITE